MVSDPFTYLFNVAHLVLSFVRFDSLISAMGVIMTDEQAKIDQIMANAVALVGITRCSLPPSVPPSLCLLLLLVLTRFVAFDY